MPPRVKRAQMQELTPEEVGAVLTAAGMRSTGPAPQQRPGQGGKSQPRHQGQGQKHRGPRPQGQGRRGPQGAVAQGNDELPHSTEPGEAMPEDEDVIEPGNSVHGNPTHGNRPVSTIFGQKGSGNSRFRDRARGPGANGSRGQGGGGFRGQGGGGPRGQESGGARPPRNGGKGPRSGAPHGSGSPYVMTTLTIPGAIPEGLPGTAPARPKGPKGPARRTDRIGRRAARDSGRTRARARARIAIAGAATVADRRQIANQHPRQAHRSRPPHRRRFRQQVARARRTE